MLVGVPKEIKQDEFRVSLTPDKVHALVREGHQVLVEKAGGEGSGFADEVFRDAGARLSTDHAEVLGSPALVVKVKEPQPSEYSVFHSGQVLFTYLHLAPEPELTQALLRSKATGMAYETVQLSDGSLPLLAPMSEVAGLLSPSIAAFCLQRTRGGPGKLLGDVAGVKPSKVVILGAGVVGTNAARIAFGMGARVVILDVKVERLRSLGLAFQGHVETVMGNPYNVANELLDADVVIGAVLIPGATAPRVVSRQMVKSMQEGCVMIDVSVDQGGCFETTHETTHSQPTYVVDGVIHYAVPNIPSMVANTSSLALSNATFPYVLALASKGFPSAVVEDQALALGVNTCDGHVTNSSVAEALGLPYRPLAEVLGRN